jgi:hypothetical protein
MENVKLQETVTWATSSTNEWPEKKGLDCNWNQVSRNIFLLNQRLGLILVVPG